MITIIKGLDAIVLGQPFVQFVGGMVRWLGLFALFALFLVFGG
jgi:hypothetical protein